MVNFIYAFIEENRSAHELLMPEDFYMNIIEPRLDEYVSFIFEDVCKQFISRRNKLAIKEKVLDIGRYWLNDSKTKTQIEIDICTKTTSGYIIYECKWKNTEIDMSVMRDLEEKAKKIQEFTVMAIGAFSRSGFTYDVNKQFERIFAPKDLFTL